MLKVTKCEFELCFIDFLFFNIILVTFLEEFSIILLFYNNDKFFQYFSSSFLMKIPQFLISLQWRSLKYVKGKVFSAKITINFICRAWKSIEELKRVQLLLAAFFNYFNVMIHPFQRGSEFLFAIVEINQNC